MRKTPTHYQRGDIRLLALYCALYPTTHNGREKPPQRLMQRGAASMKAAIMLFYKRLGGERKDSEFYNSARAHLDYCRQCMKTGQWKSDDRAEYHTYRKLSEPEFWGLIQGYCEGAASGKARNRPLVQRARDVKSKPVRSQPATEGMAEDAAIEDAVSGGLEGTSALRATGRTMSKADLDDARRRADEDGRSGEELINRYFARERTLGHINHYEWESANNAISPFDFLLHRTKKETIKVEVKSTRGDFSRTIHISINQIAAMAAGPEPFNIFRVYGLDGSKGCLRIAENVKDFAKHVWNQLQFLPPGVIPDAFSVRPDILKFGPEIVIDLTAGSAVRPRALAARRG